jgi:hypothetical protein
VSWTTELAAAETAETSYRAAAKGSFLNNYFRLDGRANVLLNDWIRARAAASSVKVPASDSRFWGNVSMRAMVAMGPSWSIVTGQLQAPPLPFLLPGPDVDNHQPFGFVQLDGLYGGLISQWAADVWAANGRTLTVGFPSQETFSWLMANSLQLAGAT